jgi:limonene-1,2-epoxide hydrolase
MPGLPPQTRHIRIPRAIIPSIRPISPQLALSKGNTDMTGIELVERFIAAWNRYDLAAVESFMAPDIFYHNIPMQPLIGIGAFRAFMAQLPATGANWQVHAIAANGPRVLTERTDQFTLADGRSISIRVMGTFEIADNKIAKWRDYFDMAEFTAQLQGQPGTPGR